ncbi:hypothetical protein FQA47_005160 [Oryzias melastigma]|uniref:Uncharacterized protein n=1 Tax=Oryzias melastigma TaxID=30732 RepID=A0A834CQY0_ORYME|nr:hypothetical protein FQA47_005160 [Oryzias melastigma]
MTWTGDDGGNEGKGEGGGPAPPPVSCLLCIQQQLCVNAWAHRVCSSVKDSILDSVQPSCRLPPEMKRLSEV